MYVLSDAELNKIANVYYKDIYRFCYSRLHANEADAADITQEVFKLLQEKRNVLKNNNIRSWLYNVTIKKLHEHYRFLEKHDYDEFQDDTITVESIEALVYAYNTDDEEIERKKKLILKSLNKEEYELYIKSVVENKTYKEIAAEMGISTDTVGRRTRKLKKHITKMVKLSNSALGIIILKYFFWLI